MARQLSIGADRFLNRIATGQEGGLPGMGRNQPGEAQGSPNTVVPTPQPPATVPPTSPPEPVVTPALRPPAPVGQPAPPATPPVRTPAAPSQTPTAPERQPAAPTDTRPPAPVPGNNRPPVVQPEPQRQTGPSFTLPESQQRPTGGAQTIVPRATPTFGKAQQEEGAAGGAWDWIRANKPNIQRLANNQINTLTEGMANGMTGPARNFLDAIRALGINPASPNTPVSMGPAAPGAPPYYELPPNAGNIPGAEEWLARAKDAPLGFTAEEAATGAGRLLNPYARGNLDPLTMLLMGQDAGTRETKEAQRATYQRLFGDIKKAAAEGGYTYDQQVERADKAVSDSQAAVEAAKKAASEAIQSINTRLHIGEGAGYATGLGPNGEIMVHGPEGVSIPKKDDQGRIMYATDEERAAYGGITAAQAAAAKAQAEADRLRHLYDNVTPPPAQARPPGR